MPQPTAAVPTESRQQRIDAIMQQLRPKIDQVVRLGRWIHARREPRPGCRRHAHLGDPDRCGPVPSGVANRPGNCEYPNGRSVMT